MQAQNLSAAAWVACALAGQNLLGSGHGEFADVATRTDFKRAVFLKLECRL
ncbi:MAG TPA: hypothetical protein VK652_11415 [Steroidobacteraceae bacterium]|nr:hypothetical protein [Steroidobacteraceae bacterium]